MKSSKWVDFIPLRPIALNLSHSVALDAPV